MDDQMRRTGIIVKQRSAHERGRYGSKWPARGLPADGLPDGDNRHGGRLTHRSARLALRPS